MNENFIQFLKKNIKVEDSKKQILFDEAMNMDEKFMTEKLISEKIIDSKALTQLKATYYHLPYLDAENLEIDESKRIPISDNLIKRYRFFPIKKLDNKLSVIISDPTNLQTLQILDFLSKKNNWEIKLFLVTDGDLEKILNKYLGVASEVNAALEEFSKDEQTHLQKTTKEVEVSEANEEKAPVAKIIEGILTQALVKKASDIHIEPTETDVRVRLRIDGILHEVFHFPNTVKNALVARVKILSNLKIDEQRLPQDGRFNFKTDGESLDFRVSTFPASNGEKIVLRALSKADEIPTFEHLGLSGQRAKAIENASKKSHGMLLVTGPTGSGKSTTLFVALSQLNKPGVNIVTLEDPIEYVLPGVNQAQVNSEIGFTFANGLRSILRQDPNVILVGEIRDKETAELAVHSSLTGHLVFSTLHTNDAIGALPRLIDMGVEPFLIVASVNVILAQRLVRTICQECKVELKPTKEVSQILLDNLKEVPADELVGIDIENLKIYKGKGCKVCGKTGYKGRIGIFEAVEMTSQISEATLLKTSPSKMQELALSQGMITIKQDGFVKVLLGKTTLEEVLKETSQ